MRRVYAVVTLLAIAACGADRSDASMAGSARSPRASSEPLPTRLGIGRPATEEEIAKLDIDVMLDGTGLPPGSATAAAGEPIFRQKCAACHGAEGEGTAAGATLVGRKPGDAFDFAESMAAERTKTIGNYWPYATTLFDYVRRAMPFDRPGSLTDAEVYALTAWLLWKNDIVTRTAVIDAKSLPEVRMPARDRFVPDDRLESTRVR